MALRIGVIADTHGKLPTAVFDIFRGVALILHAGDIGRDEIVSDLEAVARVLAVRGNNDFGYDPTRFPDTRRLTLEGVDLFLCHEPGRLLRVSPPPALVVHGHTHQPRDEQVGPTRFFNPGAVYRPRGGCPPSVGLLELDAGAVEARIITLS
jgi:putative phosphoesterase